MVEPAASAWHAAGNVNGMPGRITTTALSLLISLVGGSTAHARQVDTTSAAVRLAAFESARPEVRRLANAFHGYRALEASRPEWDPFPSDLLLKPGAASDDLAPSAVEQIPRLCDRLAVLGDLAPGDRCDFAWHYDEPIEAAVRRFQKRHGLVVDGIVGPRTVAALNVTPRQRMQHIVATIERWQQLPEDLGTRYVHVNIPEFRLRAFDDGREALSMAVVVGEPHTPTPEMRDAISYLEFSPYWNVPSSITQGELLPRLAKEPTYLEEADFEVVDGWDEPASIVDPSTIDWATAIDDFPYRLRQRPGGQNALGLVKFMFPNDHHVYLHDTPADHRFEANHRAFSHGCVRVEDPVALAELLLRDEGRWTRDVIRESMARGQRQVVPLDSEVPVYLTYFTAWVDDEGQVHFRDDLYGVNE